MRDEAQGSYLVRPVMRALQILEAVAEHGHDMSLTELCRSTGIPKTSTFRYLQTMASTGFLSHDVRRDRYGVGPRFRAIAQADSNLNRLRSIARGDMEGLVSEFSETVNLAIGAGELVVYVDVLEVDRPLRIQARVGARHPMHSTALGKAILAFLPPVDQEAYFRHPLVERTARTLLERQTIERELKRTASLGYATESGENEDGAMCIGAPILDENRYPVAAMSVSAPLQRSNRQFIVNAGRRLMEVTSTISKRLGGGYG